MSTSVHLKYFYIALNLMLGLVITIGVPITYECDAASFLNFAKYIAREGGAPSEYRMAGYPIYLVLIGGISEFGLPLIIFFNYILVSITIFLFTRLSCILVGEKLGILVSTLVTLSTLFLYTTKMALTEPLYVFLYVLVFYQIIVSENKAKEISNKDALKITISLIALVLVRYEGVLAVISILLALLFFRRVRFRNLLLILVLLSTTYLSYSLIRAYVVKSSDAVGSVQNGTGRQLFWRIYTEDYGISSMLVGTDYDVSSRLPSPEKGQKLAELDKILQSAAKHHPNWMLEQKSQFDSSDEFERYYGRFVTEINPSEFSNFIFLTELNAYSAFYPSYITKVVYNEKGIFNGDTFFKALAFEVLLARPYILYEWLDSTFSFYGLSMLDVLRLVGMKTVEQGVQLDNRPLMDKLFDRFSTNFAYGNTGYDLAGCASSTLTKSSMTFYDFDRRVYEKINLGSAVVNYLSILRNVLRTLFGPLFLASIVLLPFYFLSRKANGAGASIVLAVILNSLLYGIMAGGAQSRYEIVTLPFMILSVFYIFRVFRDDKVWSLFGFVDKNREILRDNS